MRPEYQVSCIYPSLAAEQQISAAAFIQFYFPQLFVHDRTAAGRQLAITPAAAGADALLLYILFRFCSSSHLPFLSTCTQKKKILTPSIQGATTVAAITSDTRNGATLVQPRRRRRPSRDEEDVREKMVREENVEDRNPEKTIKMQEVFRVPEKQRCYWARFADMLPRTLRGSVQHQKDKSKQHYTHVAQTPERKRQRAQQRQPQLQQQPEGHYAQNLNAQRLLTQEEQHHRREQSFIWQQHAHSHQSEEQKTIEGSWFQQENPFFHWRRNIVLVPIDVRPRHHAAAGQLPFTLLLPLEELRKQVQAFKKHMCRGSVSSSGSTENKVVSCEQTDRAKEESFVSGAKAGHVMIFPTRTSGARTQGARLCPGAVDRESFILGADAATNMKTLETAGIATYGESTVISSNADNPEEVLALARPNHSTASGLKATPGSVSKTEMCFLEAAVAVDAAEGASDPLIEDQENRGKRTFKSSIRGAPNAQLGGGASDMLVTSRVDCAVKETFDSKASKEDAASCSIYESAADVGASPVLNTEAPETVSIPHQKTNLDSTVESLAETPTSEIAEDPTEWASVRPAVPTLTQTSTDNVEGARKTDMPFSVIRQLEGRVEEKTPHYSLNALDIFVAERLLQLHRNVVRSNHIVCVMVCRRGLDSSIATSMLHELKKLVVIEEQSSSGIGGDEGVAPWLSRDLSADNSPKEMKYCKPTLEVLNNHATTTHVPRAIEGQGDVRSETSVSHRTAAAVTEVRAAAEGASNRIEEGKAKVGSATAPVAGTVDGAADLLWSKKDGVSVVNLAGGLLTLQQRYLFSMPVV